MSLPERTCDTFRRTKIKDCNDINHANTLYESQQTGIGYGKR